jgi:hypothetical protein
MLESIIEKLNDIANRRNFVGRAASAASTLALGLFGINRLAVGGGPGACCGLCTRTLCLNLNACDGTWCWTCVTGSGITCHYWGCLECYSSPPPIPPYCTSQCAGQSKSQCCYVHPTGSCCCQSSGNCTQCGCNCACTNVICSMVKDLGSCPLEAV